MANFGKFRDIVSQNFEKMCKNSTSLFVVDIDRDAMWEAYLATFPEGSNPIYIERTEHDCSCCRQFVKDIGMVVGVKDGKVSTVWDNVKDPDGVYDVVAAALGAKVRKAKIVDVFAHEMRRVGQYETTQTLEDGSVRVWSHFTAAIPTKYMQTANNSVSAIKGSARETAAVFERSLTEISVETLETIKELIDSNSIYRGAEFKATVKHWIAHASKYAKLKTKKAKNIFVWEESVRVGMACRYRNTVIGSLMVDLADGSSLDDAVRAFESRVAPANYKRPTPVVTQSMLDAARKTVDELGLEDALHRRYAVPSDVHIDDVLFVDRSHSMDFSGSVFADIAPTKATKKTGDFSKTQTMSVDDFLKTVVPTAQSIEVLFQNKHLSNLMSLVAPKIPGSPQLLAWENNISWTYRGDVTDSRIRERVKKAGGNVEADVRISLAWSNCDDLDIHVHEPTGDHLYYATRGRTSACGGMLDVDANAGFNRTRTPVENITYRNAAAMRAGVYRVEVAQYTRREKLDEGFELEVVIGDNTRVFSSKVNKHTNAFDLVVDKNGGIELKNIKLDESSNSQEVWGIETEKFQKVSMMSLSPNFWQGQSVGNKHLFFFIEGCKSDESARGLYNEFLSGKLTPHRKVFELLGGKMKAPVSDEQLSGIGFSFTQENTITVRVTGSTQRIIDVKF